MATFTFNGTGATRTPVAVGRYSSSSEAVTVSHELLDGRVRYTVRGAQPRSGTVRSLWSSEASAWGFFDFIRQPGAFTLTDPDVPATGMGFVVQGQISIDQDADGDAWHVDIPFKELL